MAAFTSLVEPAISRPISSAVPVGSTSPAIRPRYMTPMRSARPRTSSSSVETSTTAAPRSRSATMRRCTNSIEPTSSPRVGWATTSSRAAATARARARPSAGCRRTASTPAPAVEVVRTSNSSTRVSRVARDRVELQRRAGGERAACRRGRGRGSRRPRTTRPARRAGGPPGT